MDKAIVNSTVFIGLTRYKQEIHGKYVYNPNYKPNEYTHMINYMNTGLLIEILPETLKTEIDGKWISMPIEWFIAKSRLLQ